MTQPASNHREWIVINKTSLPKWRSTNEVTIYEPEEGGCQAVRAPRVIHRLSTTFWFPAAISS
jgi:hypothetical protein